MSLKLVKGSYEYKNLIVDMLDEWTEYNAIHGLDNIPWILFKNSYKDFDYFLDNLETKEATDQLVPDSTFFCLDEKRNIIVGVFTIRHYLNDFLLKYGGHIGYAIRPSERRKGYATKFLKLTLEECKKLGITKALITANKDNIGSIKAILNNGGVLENEVVDKDGIIKQRYLITIE